MRRTFSFHRQVTLLSALLVATTLSGCAAIAQWQGGFGNDKTHQLARQVMLNIPKPEGDGERRFTWALFLPPANDRNPELTSEVMHELRRDYEVFTDLNSIPPDRIVGTERGIEGFRRGFSFKFAVTELKGGRVKLQYWSYGISRGTVTHATTYVWADGDWRPVRKSPTRMS